MNKQKFWAIIEKTEGDPNKAAEYFRGKSESVVEAYTECFEKIQSALLEDDMTDTLANLCQEFTGHISDDTFSDFLNGLVCGGRKAYHAILGEYPNPTAETLKQFWENPQDILIECYCTHIEMKWEKWNKIDATTAKLKEEYKQILTELANKPVLHIYTNNLLEGNLSDARRVSLGHVGFRLDKIDVKDIREGDILEIKEWFYVVDNSRCVGKQYHLNHLWHVTNTDHLDLLTAYLKGIVSVNVLIDDDNYYNNEIAAGHCPDWRAELKKVLENEDQFGGIIV